MTKYVISGYIGFDNFGDEAIAGCLTEHLKQLGAEKITVISANPGKTSRLFGVNSVKFLDFIRPIMESDVLISGGGSLLQDITSLKSLIYYLSVIMTAIVSGKKVFIFAQGFTPFRTKIGEILTKFVLKHCYKITVRDKNSQIMLDKMGIHSEIISDPVFSININPCEKHGLGVQIRSFKTLNEDFVESLAKEIAYNFKETEVKLFSLQDNIDLPAVEKLAELLAGYGVTSKIYKNMSVFEVISEISGLEYLIGMRFHADIIGVKSYTKVLGINYDIKVKSLAEEVGFPYINMIGCEAAEGIKKLLKVNPEEYNLPEFKFPDFNE